jgi:hypothetical protein
LSTGIGIGRRQNLPQLQTEQHLLGVGQIADDAPQRRRELFDQRRRREDLVFLRLLRILQHIDDLELITPLEILLANAAKVLDCGKCPWSRAGDVQLEQKLRQMNLGRQEIARRAAGQARRSCPLNMRQLIVTAKQPEVWTWGPNFRSGGRESWNAFGLIRRTNSDANDANHANRNLRPKGLFA